NRGTRAAIDVADANRTGGPHDSAGVSRLVGLFVAAARIAANFLHGPRIREAGNSWTTTDSRTFEGSASDGLSTHRRTADDPRPGSQLYRKGDSPGRRP